MRTWTEELLNLLQKNYLSRKGCPRPYRFREALKELLGTLPEIGLPIVWPAKPAKMNWKRYNELNDSFLEAVMAITQTQPAPLPGEIKPAVSAQVIPTVDFETVSVPFAATEIKIRACKWGVVYWITIPPVSFLLGLTEAEVVAANSDYCIATVRDRKTGVHWPVFATGYVDKWIASQDIQDPARKKCQDILKKVSIRDHVLAYFADKEKAAREAPPKPAAKNTAYAKLEKGISMVCDAIIELLTEVR